MSLRKLVKGNCNMKDELFKDTKKGNAKRDRLKRLIIERPNCITFIKNKYLTDDILEECLNDNPDIFPYIKHPTTAIINMALEMDGGNLKFINDDQRNNLPLDSIRIALESDAERAIDYVVMEQLPIEMQIDLFLKNPVLALTHNANIPESYIIKEIYRTPNIIKYVANPTEEMKCLALSLEPNVALYFSQLSDKMMDIIDEKYPQLIGKIPNYTRNICEGENNGSTNQN